MSVGIDIARLEDRLGRRLTRKEVALLRDAADRIDAMSRFNATLAELRQAHPAAVSPTWGIA